ncbi:MAG: VOC family protein, partial [Candidatus Lokiarchaeota archaeon]
MHLWFDKEAKSAAKFYTSIFKNSKIKSQSTLQDSPSGPVDMVTIDLLDQEFTLISAGPLFKFNPSISFLVARETKDEINTLWEKLSLEGEILMELGEYPFSEKYGWIRDKFGVSWQIMYTTRKIQQFIT